MQWKCEGWTFDSETRQLLHNGQPVTLSPKAFHLLEILIENRPKALSKAQLHDHLWPDTFVVEANLSNLIGEVRHALDDDSQQPRFIRTIHRFGYGFVGEAVEPRLVDGSSSTVCRVLWADGSATLRDGAHVIGRSPDAAVFLDSPGVSRRHALLHVRSGEASLEDLGSKNGSSVAGRPVKGTMQLADGDVITIGVVELTFRMLRPQVPTETVSHSPESGDRARSSSS
jgi:DNA-binding winged helix-turn-helix (wHTH) protein